MMVRLIAAVGVEYVRDGQGEAAAEKFTRATAALDDEGWN